MALLKKIVKSVFVTDEMKEPQLIDLTYVWKIEILTLTRMKESEVSNAFSVGKDLYTLELSKNENIILKLAQVKPCVPAVKLLCTVGLIDRLGKLCHFARKEAEMGKGSETKELLKIPSQVLQKEKIDVFPKGVLSVHLTINLHMENTLLTPFMRGPNLESLSCHMRKLLEDTSKSDVMLKFDDTVYKAHRLVLSARSPTFAQIFRRNSKGCSKEIINIKDVEGSLFGNVLYYIYTGKVRGLTTDTASRLIEAADKYHLNELKSICISYLAAHLKMENICDAILLAEKFRDEQLEKAAFEFICKNANAIIDSDQWKTFKTEYTAIANSVLSSILLSAKMK